MLALEDRTWKLNLFGPLEIRDPDGNARPLASRKGSELLAFLAMRRTPSVDRDVIGEALWPEADLITARNRLRATLSYLKRDVPGIPIITHGKRFVELRREDVAIDYEVCERRLKWRRALAGPGRAGFAKQLLEITGKGLLRDVQAPWAQYDRDRYAGLNQQLELDVADGGADVEARFSVDDELGGVRVPLVGRAAELWAVDAWITDPTVRRLHLVGMPGVGKTRILREVLQARKVVDASISLSTVQSTEVPWLERLGQLVGVRKSEEVSGAVTRLLADFRHPLLVLDDIDQAGNEMRAWIDQIMVAVPHLKLLGTARQRPSDSNIAVCLVKPLPVGETTNRPATDLLKTFAMHFGADADELERCRLDLDGIADFLDGLPLALEIAAAWIPTLTPGTLYQKLQTSPDLITQRAGAGRNSLVECVSAICADLDSEDRHALMCLCVCRGGCGEELGEAMLGADWHWRVRTLVDRSLALRVPGHSGHRFLVVQALREAVRFAEGEQRYSSAKRVWQDACLSAGRRAHFEVNERDRRRWMQWLRDEGDNIVSASVAAAEDPANLREAIDVLHGLQGPLWLLGRSRGFEQAFEELLQQGLDHFGGCDEATPTPVVDHSVHMLRAKGDVEEAFRIAQRHRIALEPSEDALRLATALDIEAQCRFDLGDVEGAIDCWIRYASLCDAAGYRRHALWIESKLTRANIELGRFASALANTEQALKRGEELGDDNSIGMYRKELAARSLERHEFDKAIDLAQGAVDAFRRAAESVNLGTALCGLGIAYASSNRFGEARQALAEAQSLCPDPYEELSERMDVLRGILANPIDAQIYYDHLTAED